MGSWKMIAKGSGMISGSIGSGWTFGDENIAKGGKISSSAA